MKKHGHEEHALSVVLFDVEPNVALEHVRRDIAPGRGYGAGIEFPSGVWTRRGVFQTTTTTTCVMQLRGAGFKGPE